MNRNYPRTEEERQARHETLFPGTPLPERGTGWGRMEGQYGAGRRREYWAREGGLLPPAELTRSINKVSEVSEGEEPSIPISFGRAILTGLGLGVGFAIIHKLTRA